MEHDQRGAPDAYRDQPDLLLTRLYAPPVRPDLVARPRINALLQRGRCNALTLVSAPAGSGKTTAVVAWLAEARSTRTIERTAWLSLDTDADDPARFWAYLAAACDHLAPGCAAHVQALLQTNQPPAAAVLVAALSNRLASLPWDGAAERPYVLVLDDYHAIERLEIHDGLSRLIDHLPPQIRMVITTRADPPLPLARLRARGQLTELRAADLRFARDELADMLAVAGAPPLSAAALDTLTARTEGWAAGLRLVLLALHGHTEPDRFIAAFAGTHRYLVDYLADEVLDREPAHLRRFLLETSILDRLCGPLCDAVLGIGSTDTMGEPMKVVSSQRILDEVERRGLFLIALDDERRWYRYHHLFADVLRARLHDLAAEMVPTLHRRASAWYVAAAATEPTLLANAVRHALAAGDANQAADLVERAVARIWNQGDLRITLELLRLLPEDTVTARPWLALALARTTLSTGDIEAVGLLLTQITAMLDAGAGQGDTDRLRGWVAALRAHEARLHERPDAAFAHATTALALLPPDDMAGRGFVTLGLAMSHHVAGALVMAIDQYTVAIQLLRASGDRYNELYATAMLSSATLMRGELATAGSLLTEALGRAQVGGVTLPVAAMIHTALGEIAYLRDDLAGAQAHCAEALSLAVLGQVRDAVLVGHELWVKIDLAVGDTAAAARRAAALLAHTEAARIPQLIAWARSVSAWVSLVLGRVTDATAWAAGYRMERGPLSPIRADEFVTYLRVLLGTGRAGEARALVEQQLPYTITSGYAEQQLQFQVLGALACAAENDAVSASRWLMDALQIAAPQRIRRPFLSAGAPMVSLLQTAIAALSLDPSLSSFAHSLVGKSLPAAAPAINQVTAVPDLVEPLTSREREILRLTASGLSNQEIANLLVIGVGTVKTHLHSLYGKLDARDRMSAVIRARTLGLLT